MQALWLLAATTQPTTGSLLHTWGTHDMHAGAPTPPLRALVWVDPSSMPLSSPATFPLAAYACPSPAASSKPFVCAGRAPQLLKHPDAP